MTGGFEHDHGRRHRDVEALGSALMLDPNPPVDVGVVGQTVSFVAEHERHPARPVGLGVPDALVRRRAHERQPGSADIVVKSLSDNFTDIRGLSGASIMGDGTVCLMLDVGEVIKLATERSSGARPSLSV